MTLESLCQAVALVGSRLRRDVEGEQALVGDCQCGCRPLIEGLLLVAELSVGLMAERDKVMREHAADVTARLLRSILAREAG